MASQPFGMSQEDMILECSWLLISIPTKQYEIFTRKELYKSVTIPEESTDTSPHTLGEDAVLLNKTEIKYDQSDTFGQIENAENKQ